MNVVKIWEWLKALRKHDDMNVHAFPEDDVFEHMKTESCPCCPDIELDYKFRTRTVVHRSLKEIPQ